MDAVEIPLTRGKVALVSPEDAEWIAQWKWYADGPEPWVYAVRKTRRDDPAGGRKRLYMHRVIMQPPDDMVIDHTDDNTLNNTRENLRICTYQQNVVNARRTSSKYGFRGVHFRTDKPTAHKRWRAVIKVCGRAIKIGTYATAREAAIAYDAAALKHYGEFARLNFPQHSNEPFAPARLFREIAG